MKSKKIILVAHCVLNQNSVLEGWARARGAYPIADILLKEGIGIIQLPCPELLHGGLSRPPLGVRDYDRSDYRALCAELLLPYIRQLKEYVKHGYEFLGVVGIQSSPTCAFGGVRGVMADVLTAMLSYEKIKLPYVDIPEDYREGMDDAALHKKILNLVGR